MVLGHCLDVHGWANSGLAAQLFSGDPGPNAVHATQLCDSMGGLEKQARIRDPGFHGHMCGPSACNCWLTETQPGLGPVISCHRGGQEVMPKTNTDRLGEGFTGA